MSLNINFIMSKALFTQWKINIISLAYLLRVHIKGPIFHIVPWHPICSDWFFNEWYKFFKLTIANSPYNTTIYLKLRLKFLETVTEVALPQFYNTILL